MLFANARSNARKSQGNDSIAMEGAAGQGSSQEIYDPEVENSMESQELENHNNKSVFITDGEYVESSDVTELRNAQVIAVVSESPAPSPTPPTKRPRGRPRRQPATTTTPVTIPVSAVVENDSEICENTPPNSVEKRRMDGDSQSESEPEPKKQRSDEDSNDDTRSKYQQYWEKHCPTRLQTKLIEASKSSPNSCGQNKADKSSKADEQGAR
ncbi:sister chromatid cohesion protein PDS5 B-A [Trichonephila inaurata madagascariensis]|uniref:Sister chromatid cohesion protein PDS5 B-A n=1 Tax=Trichonephila inaurata madagascariensis TaxID=2747483 RepID=A0A8X6XS02_9ARAC|nr:sister chromatid cohesion protein PDS5 B-A [Trichonephila inaurata madagascariensis]